MQPPDLDIDDLVHVRAAEAVEQDDLVQPVEEFGAEMRAHRRHHLRARGGSPSSVAGRENSVPRFEVRMITVFGNRPCGPARPSGGRHPAPAAAH